MECNRGRSLLVYTSYPFMSLSFSVRLSRNLRVKDQIQWLTINAGRSLQYRSFLCVVQLGLSLFCFVLPDQTEKETCQFCKGPHFSEGGYVKGGVFDVWLMITLVSVTPYISLQVSECRGVVLLWPSVTLTSVGQRRGWRSEMFIDRDRHADRLGQTHYNRHTL